MICTVLGFFSKLGSNQVVSRGLTPIRCNRPVFLSRTNSSGTIEACYKDNNRNNPDAFGQFLANAVTV